MRGVKPLGLEDVPPGIKDYVSGRVRVPKRALKIIRQLYPADHIRDSLEKYARGVYPNAKEVLAQIDGIGRWHITVVMYEEVQEGVIEGV